MEPIANSTEVSLIEENGRRRTAHLPACCCPHTQTDPLTHTGMQQYWSPQTKNTNRWNIENWALNHSEINFIQTQKNAKRSQPWMHFHRKEPRFHSFDFFHLAHAYTLRCSHMCVCMPIQNSQMDYNQNRNYATKACLKLFLNAHNKERGRFSLTLRARFWPKAFLIHAPKHLNKCGYSYPIL